MGHPTLPLRVSKVDSSLRANSLCVSCMCVALTLPWHTSCEAEANLQLQSSQTLIRDNVPPTRLLDKICRKVRWTRRGSSLSSCLVKGLLVADLSKPVPDRLLVITLLRLPRRVVRPWP